MQYNKGSHVKTTWNLEHFRPLVQLDLFFIFLAINLDFHAWKSGTQFMDRESERRGYISWHLKPFASLS